MKKTYPSDGKFSLMTLPYPADALAVISAETLSYHHGKHLKAYIDNLNAALPGSGFEALPLEDIVCRAQGAIFNNAGQVLNHNMYFGQFKAPGAGSGAKDGLSGPKGALGKAIEETFGSFEAFFKEFAAKGAGLFGSGWVWLSKDGDGKLVITQESNAGNPVTAGLVPLLTIDVWEHAYYLDYQNRRADYIKAVESIIDWDVIAARYEE